MIRRDGINHRIKTDKRCWEVDFTIIIVNGSTDRRYSMEVFRDKVAVVTGGGSGIGKALSEKLAAMGAEVHVSDIDTCKAEQTVSNIVATGGSAWCETLDVTDYQSFERYIERIFSTHGRVDYLFNNAGVEVFSELYDLQVENWHRVIDINLNGVFYGSLVTYKRMVRQGWGHIVNMSSVAGLIPFPLNTAYVASKYAVLGFTQTLWVEAGEFNVRVSAVCPGYIPTPIFDNAFWINIDKDKAHSAEKFFSRFSMTPEQCSDVILKGVADNQPIIPVTLAAHFAWLLARLSPIGVMRIIRRKFDKHRRSIRSASERVAQ